MKVPHWFTLACGLLLFNALLIISSVISRHAVADPPSIESAKPPELTLDKPSPNDPPGLSEVPSLDELPISQKAPSVLRLEDFERVFKQQSPTTDALLAPLDDTKDEANIDSQFIAQSYFESLRLRLQTANQLTEAASGLIEEAAMQAHRGEIGKSRELLGMATQLREMAAKLLVAKQ